MAQEDELPTNIEEFFSSVDTFSNLGRVDQGSGLAFRSLACPGKRIEKLKGLEAYVHLAHVDLSQNLIKDVGLFRPLKNLIMLNLSKNGIKDFKGLEPNDEDKPMPNLTHLDLSSNQFSALPPLHFEALKVVNFANNAIATCHDFTGHPQIQQLNLSENALSAATNVAAMPALKKLDLSRNKLHDINGLADVPELTEFCLAGNPMQALEGPWQDLSGLKSLDISHMQLPKPAPLEILRNLPKLRSLNVTGNPFIEDGSLSPEDARIEVLICHWRLTTINEVAVNDEEIVCARDRNVERLKKAADEAKEKETAEAGES
jgi:Leucine-rich repeat (LRR) protein